MNSTCNKKLTGNAQRLRRSMTKEERHLWYDCLKLLPLTVHRQKVIGSYIVDFYIAQAGLVIELDGSQHFEPEHQLLDSERDNYLKEQGLKVLRIPNNEVNQNFRGVCERIWDLVQLKSLPLEGKL